MCHFLYLFERPLQQSCTTLQTVIIRVILRIFTAHVQNAHIPTSVTIVFLDADFMQDAGISAIRVHLTQL